MKVLLIEPRSCWIGLNIALGYIAAALKDAGIEVLVLDFTNHREWPAEQLTKRIVLDYEPDLIGIPMFYISYFQVKEMIEGIRRYYSGRIVVGGPQMMIEREDILSDMPGLDFGVVGDGEKAIVALCKAIEGRLPLTHIPGLVFRDGGVVAGNEQGELTEDIDQLPFPDYRAFGVKKMRLYQLITSRGCPFSCAYCFRSSRKWRPRSPGNIVDEIENAISLYGIEEFAICDDSFNINRERVIEFCHILRDRDIHLRWFCTGVRADRMTEDVARAMKEAGCYSVAIGVETLQPELLETLNRTVKISDIVRCIKILKRFGISVTGYFMIGLPGDTPGKTEDTFKKARQLGLDDASISIFLPMPGTALYKKTYAMSGVRRLNDYRNVSTIWTNDPIYSKMKVAFDTPEFQAEAKVKLYNMIRTRYGDPRPPYRRSKILFAAHCAWWVLKYDFWRSPITLQKLAKSACVRLINSKGRHLYKYDNHYEEEFISYYESKLC